MNKEIIQEAVKSAVIELLPMIREEIPFDRRLWDADECAKALGVARTTFHKLSSQPNFPKPQVDTNTRTARGHQGRRSLRWRAIDVVRFNNVRG